MKHFKNLLIVAAAITALHVHSNYIVHNVKNTNDNLHKRIDVLVRDSVRMHKWYENVELNYQELNNLKP